MQWNEFIQTDHTYTDQEWPYRVGINQLSIKGELKLLRNNMPINQEPIEVSSAPGQARFSLNGNSEVFESIRMNLVVAFSEDIGAGYQLSELTDRPDTADVLIVYCSKAARYYNTFRKPLISGQAVFEKILVDRNEVFENVVVQAFLVLREDSGRESDTGALKKGSVISFSRDIEILTDAKHNLFSGGINQVTEEFSPQEKNALYKIDFDGETSEPYIIWNKKYEDVIRFLKQPKSSESAYYKLQHMMLSIISHEIMMQTLAGVAGAEENIEDLEDDFVEMKILNSSRKYIHLTSANIHNDIRGTMLQLEKCDSLTRMQHGLKLGQAFSQCINSSMEEAVNG